MATPMWQAGHHTQITAVVILLPAHSYIVLGGEDAIWLVLDGKVALGRDTEMNDILLDQSAFYVESISATTITKHLFKGYVRGPAYRYTDTSSYRMAQLL